MTNGKFISTKQVNPSRAFDDALESIVADRQVIKV